MQTTKTPTLSPCESTAISAYGYDDSEHTLYLTFKSGNTYAYAGVPPDVFSGLASAESIGRYYAANIKGRHEAVPIGVAAPAQVAPETVAQGD